MFRIYEMVKRTLCVLLTLVILWLIAGCAGKQAIPDETRFAGAEKRVFETFSKLTHSCSVGEIEVPGHRYHTDHLPDDIEYIVKLISFLKRHPQLGKSADQVA